MKTSISVVGLGCIWAAYSPLDEARHVGIPSTVWCPLTGWASRVADQPERKGGLVGVSASGSYTTTTTTITITTALALIAR